VRTRLYVAGEEIAGKDETAGRRDRVEGGERGTGRRTECLADGVVQDIDIDVASGEAVAIEKIAALFTSADKAASEAGLEAVEQVARAPPRFSRLLGVHSRAWERLWDACDINVELAQDELAQDEQIPMKLRLHIFHLLQTASYHTVDLDAGVPPRGWHGEAYRGHIMWDEMFIFPFLALRVPVITRALLRYRDRRLPAVQRLAEQAGLQGAMFPWQSGSNGREQSQKIHLNPMSGRWIPDNSYRQRHIAGAIAWNVWQYYQVTEDREHLFYHGVRSR
jgi:alpha,alpha-trehalase